MAEWVIIEILLAHLASGNLKILENLHSTKAKNKTKKQREQNWNKRDKKFMGKRGAINQSITCMLQVDLCWFKGRGEEVQWKAKETPFLDFSLAIITSNNHHAQDSLPSWNWSGKISPSLTLCPFPHSNPIYPLYLRMETASTIVPFVQ